MFSLKASTYVVATNYTDLSRHFGYSGIFSLSYASDMHACVNGVLLDSSIFSVRIDHLCGAFSDRAHAVNSGCANFDTIQLYERVILENCHQNFVSSPAVELPY
jgi:hypothetical protein